MKCLTFLFSYLALLFAYLITTSATISVARADEIPVEELRDVELSDLAKTALGISDFSTGRRCTTCHQISARKVIDWGTKFSAITMGCLHGKTVSELAQVTPKDAQGIINCLRIDPTNHSAPFSPLRLGLWAGGTEQMRVVFERSGLAHHEQLYAQFTAQARMPLRSVLPQFSAYDLAVFGEWIKRDYPELDRDDEGHSPPPMAGCTPETSDELVALLADSHANNWGVKNKLKGVLPFACSPTQPTINCFTAKNSQKRELFPLVQNTKLFSHINTNTKKWNIRQVAMLPYTSVYWTRSSADGRFLAAGVDRFVSNPLPPEEDGYASGVMVDLNPTMQGQPVRLIPVFASYDPGFFADNSGFSFQGLTSADSQRGTMFCDQNILKNPGLKVLKSNQAGCNEADLRLYHSTGVGLGGDDYMAIGGDFNGDTGNEGRDTNEEYAPTVSELKFTSLLYDGKKYSEGRTATLEFSNEHDFILSPASNLLTSRRFAVDLESHTTRQDGYNIRAVSKTTNASGDLQVATKVVGRVCLRGSKAVLSTNQRFLPFYRYIRSNEFAEFGFASNQDPKFREMIAQGTANVYIYDLLTQKDYRITTMPAGMRATFPHFRTDDWLMFIVKNAQNGREFVMSTDIALRIMQEGD